jgi:ribosomal protein L37AE/L43A
MAKKIIPKWAPRIKKSKIQRLYEFDALGIQDDELILEVGYTLLARCRSFFDANQATSGNAICPVCERLVAHNCNKDEILHCDQCGWELSWGDYFGTIQKKQLFGAEPVQEAFREFVDKFPKAKDYPNRMFLIDRVIHQFHFSIKYGNTRPTAINLIEGRLGEIIKFLDELSYGSGSTPGIKVQKDAWVEKSQNARSWSSKGKKL